MKMGNEVSVVGIDVGGTKIAAGVMRFPSGERGSPQAIPTNPRRGGQAVLKDVVTLAGRLADEAQGNAPPSAIGLGICELVDREGNLASASTIDWLSLPVREALSAIAPAVLEADVRAAALAESRLGAGRPFKNFLYVTIGTGVSCCLVLEGEPYLGARGLTGTMASSPLALRCEECGSTNRRTLEEIASGPALAARFQLAGGNAATGQEVLTAASKGDPVAREVVASACEALEWHVGLLVNALDPEAVIIGGGLGLSEGPFWNHFVASTRKHIWSRLHRDLPILHAETGTDAGWIGAALSAARKLQPQSQIAVNQV